MIKPIASFGEDQDFRQSEITDIEYGACDVQRHKILPTLGAILSFSSISVTLVLIVCFPFFVCFPSETNESPQRSYWMFRHRNPTITILTSHTQHSFRFFFNLFCTLPFLARCRYGVSYFNGVDRDNDFETRIRFAFAVFHKTVCQQPKNGVLFTGE